MVTVVGPWRERAGGEGEACHALGQLWRSHSDCKTCDECPKEAVVNKFPNLPENTIFDAGLGEDCLPAAEYKSGRTDSSERRTKY